MILQKFSFPLQVTPLLGLMAELILNLSELILNLCPHKFSRLIQRLNL
jgi:hypothetical protein